MGVAGFLRRAAASSRAPVFALSGAGARHVVQDLRLDARVNLVPTPRSASVLLVAGHIHDDLIDAVVATHDQVAEPRCTVVWSPSGSAERLRAALPHATVAHSDLAATIAREHRDLVLGDRTSEPALLPDVDPAPWRGVGPYGQGGSGMTGGVPFGRPMADRAPDRDGLALDQIPLRVGPFFSALPHGLVLDVALQGGVVQSLQWQRVDVGESAVEGGLTDPFVNALSRPARIGELELARARSHLRWMAEGLGVYGLEGLGTRVLRLASDIDATDSEEVAGLERTLRRAGIFGYATAGVGVMDPGAMDGTGLGPTARAAGLAEDVRSDDAAYAELGFEPIVHTGADVRARWRQRFAEVVQSLRMATAAGDRRTEPTGRVESPRGRLERHSSPAMGLAGLLPGLIEGQEWGDAVATLVSLDIDPDSQ